MNIQQVLAEYDGMFGNRSLVEIEQFLADKLKEAENEADKGAQFTLLNEMIGLCRDTTQKAKALYYCEQLKELLTQMKLEGRPEYATALLNIANAYRAFGLHEESLELYKLTEKNYRVNLKPDDFGYASLYNNWSLLYQEMGDFENAREMLLKALAVVDQYEQAAIEQAITRTNLAATLLQLKTDADYEAAMRYLMEALEIFERDGGQDFHYGAALAAMGDAQLGRERFKEAADYYARGMKEIEKHVGRTDNYVRVREKYEFAVSQLKENAWVSNLERCRVFYEQYGKQMIHDRFPEYEERIAVGLVGEGSDCFGFDDEISSDHDYGLGFCMWLQAEDYVKIGRELKEAYDELIREHGDDNGRNRFLEERRGVFIIDDFYADLLQIEREDVQKCRFDYLRLEEHCLAAAVNGKVFRDDEGKFSSIRHELLNYYPEDIWRLRLSRSLHEFSQYAQSNYPRMMARKDYATAQLCVARGMECAMDIVYLLNRTYAPYYKWKRKGLEKLPLLTGMAEEIDRIALLDSQKDVWENVTYQAGVLNLEDACVRGFEKIAEDILEELRKQNLVTGQDAFLELYCGEIVKGRQKDTIDKIVRLEWKQFDRVKNEGGRADCQDDWNTFSLMRESQYLTWSMELLESYYQDLTEAETRGRNLIMEKYARMMESTAPERYAEFSGQLPELSAKRKEIQEEIIRIQVGWMEEFAEKYPKMAGNARSIHTYEDSEYDTSYETYLRGELGTYSEQTFILYGRFITSLMQKGKNLAYETMSNTAKLYGYSSVEDVERRL
ncbi:MAG: DUF4125 family protein [Lachnospiraceae bacterium]|nr:DUF4125 family protein [Lachnospiraceae bacterium]